MNKFIKNPFARKQKGAVVTLWFCLFASVICAQTAEKFDFPMKPGMEEWNRLETEQERISVLQVPEAILATLSPDDAVRLCITLPAFFIFYAFNTPQDGFAVLLSRYNILRHLMQRKDIGSCLIETYKDADLSGFRTLPYSNEFWTVKLYYLELLLSQKEILQSLTPDEKLELIKEARTKLIAKITNEAFAFLNDLLFSVRIMANILDVEEYPELFSSSNNEAIKRFIETGAAFDGVPIDEIFRISDNYINAKNSQQ